MAKCLSDTQLKENLKLGKPLEQWISSQKKEDYIIIKWLRLDKEKGNTFNVAYFEVFDEGNENYLDIYEFSPLDPDYPYGIIDMFDSVESAIDFAVNSYGASLDKFVSAGIIQEEYLNYLRER